LLSCSLQRSWAKKTQREIHEIACNLLLYIQGVEYHHLFHEYSLELSW
jgi:hypothetical protein